MNKNMIGIALFVTCLSLVSVVNAEPGSSYAGIGFGNATPEDSAFDSAMGWKIFGGYEISKNFAVEGGYTSLGEMDGPIILGFSTSVAITGFEVAAKGNLPMNEQFSLFGKLGFLAWDFEVNIAGLGSASTSGTDIFLGFGGKFNISQTMAAQLAWEIYEVEGDNVDLLSVGLTFGF